MFRRFIAMLRHLGLTRLATILVAVSCGNRDPVPVGVDLVDRLSGETIELAPALPSQASTRFEGLLPIVRGISGELMVGRSNGIVYSALLRVPQDSLSGIQGELAAANLRLTLNPGQQRGLGQFALFRPITVWEEDGAFVDTTDLSQVPFESLLIRDGLTEDRQNSTLTLALPPAAIKDAQTGGRNLELMLSPAVSTTDDFVVVTCSREVEAINSRPTLELILSSGDTLTTVPRADTYFADRIEPTAMGDLILHTGVTQSVRLKYDIPTNIPPGSTINWAELTADIDTDRSLVFDVLEFSIRRLDVIAETTDTVLVTTSVSNFNTQHFTSAATSIRIPLDRLLVQTWIAGTPNNGLALTPNIEGLRLEELQYEWAVLRNPRLRVIYSIPPSTGPE